MNKSAIALAVAAALAASGAVQADTTLYGSARVSVDYIDPDDIQVLREDGSTESIGANDGQWDVFNNSSRLGVRGSEDLGGGLQAIYQYEFGVDMTEGGNLESNRPKLVGLKGGFGQLSVGTQWTPYYNVLGVNDVFNSSRTFDTNYLGFFRFDNSVVYKTPNWNGLTLEGMLNMDEGRGKDSIDIWQVNIKYENGPFMIGGVYLRDLGGCPDGAGSGSGSNCFAFDDDGNGIRRDRFDQFGAAIAYSGTRWGASLIYEYKDFDRNFELSNNEEIDERWNINGVLEYTFGSNIIRGSYSYLDNDDPDESVEWVLGFQHNLSKRSRLWVEYIGSDDTIFRDTIDDEEVVGQGEKTVFSIGMRHDF